MSVVINQSSFRKSLLHASQQVYYEYKEMMEKVGKDTVQYLKEMYPLDDTTEAKQQERKIYDKDGNEVLPVLMDDETGSIHFSYKVRKTRNNQLTVSFFVDDEYEYVYGLNEGVNANGQPLTVFGKPIVNHIESEEDNGHVYSKFMGNPMGLEMLNSNRETIPNADKYHKYSKFIEIAFYTALRRYNKKYKFVSMYGKDTTKTKTEEE